MLLLLLSAVFTYLILWSASAAGKPLRFSIPQNMLISTQGTIRQESSGDGRGGLSFEKCDLLGCKSPRFCRLISDRDIICSRAGACHCLPSSFVQCSSHAHCVEGEVCAEVDDFGTVCAAESFVNDFAGAKKLPGEKAPPPPFPSDDGLTFDPCDLLTCDFPRFCWAIADEERICTNALACHCVPSQLISCSSSRDCVDREVCASVPDRGTICVSESYANHDPAVSTVSSGNPSSSGDSQKPPTQDPPVPSGSPRPSQPSQPSQPSLPTGSPVVSSSASVVNPGGVESSLGEPVCIAAQSLHHLPRHELRFKTDIDAHVLCDQSNSCATPGHMIEYLGKTMMMASYCKLTVCERRNMKVNSPRYQRGMKIPSRTPGLIFTVFAARYETFTEEVVLKTILRLGM